ncbi:MAG: DUF2169 domain-containing protein [Polyangiaceae bacterium]
MRQSDLDSESSPGAEILVDGPFAASTLFWRSRRGELRCTILAKTTYALLPRVCPVVEPSEPLLMADAHWDGAPEKSARTPSDRVPFKHQPEVLLSGHAYATGRRPQQRLGVRLVVGDLDTALEVFPPRKFGADGMLEEPAAARMPLAYEYAAGGSDSDNPVGIDMGLVDAWGRRGAPSVLRLGAACEEPGDLVMTAGWGPIAPHWPSRARRLRAEDRAWLADPAKSSMPVGFDARFFQSAPHEQWLQGPIRPDERVVLEHLSPAHERLVTNLEGIVPYARIHGAKELRIPLIADTLFIDTDRATLTLTWRGLVMVDERAPRLVLAIARASGRITTPPPPALSGPGPVITARERLLAEVETTNVGTPIGGVAAIATPLPFAVQGGPARGATHDYDDDALPFRTPDADLAATKQRPSLASLHLPLGAPPAPETRPDPVPPRLSLTGLEVPIHAEEAPPSPPAPPPPPPMSHGGLPAWAPPSTGLLAPVPEASREGLVGSGWTSLRAASDAAAPAASSASWSTFHPQKQNPEQNQKRLETKADPMRQAFEPLAEIRRHAFVDLLAHDAALAPRLRRTPAFSKLLAAHAERPPWVRPDEPYADKPREDRDRADVLRVLSFTAPCDLVRTRELVEEAFDDAEQLELPLVVIAGTLKPTHDDVAVLRATVHAGQPLSLTNKPLQTALKVIEEAIDGGGSPSGEATAALLRQAEQAAGQLWGYLQSQVTRAVLEERHFKRRTVLGEVRIRAELAMPSGESIPAYIPATVATKLPMLSAFPAVVLADLRPREDAQESHAEALLVWALGRVVRQGHGRNK